MNRRATTVAALALAAWLGLGALSGVAAAQTPTSIPCAPPITVGPTKKPTPSSSPTPSRSPAPSPTPSASTNPQPTADPSTAPPATVGPPPLTGSLEPPASASSSAPAPVVATPSPSTAPSSAPVFRIASGRIPLAAGFFAVVAGVLVTPLLIAFLASRLQPAGTTSGVVAPHVSVGGSLMHPTSRWRLWFGVGSLGLAALISVIGWYKISGERLVNFQVPLLASAGLAVVLLSVLGGSMLVADQMRGDDRRLDDLEEAVRTLAAALAPSIESPARRSGSVVVTPPDPEPEADTSVDTDAAVALVEPAEEKTDGTTTRRRRSRPTS